MAAKVNKDYITLATDVACGNRNRMVNFILHLLLMIAPIQLVNKYKGAVGCFSKCIRTELTNLIEATKTPYEIMQQKIRCKNSAEYAVKISVKHSVIDKTCA